MGFLLTRQQAEEAERTTLASYALHSAESRGRRFPEEADEYRTVFARDRDRIVHSGAFRRLEYKTQVVLSGTGDNYRTRLTHTLEVAQIARSLAQVLRLNQDFVECLALAHDIGHPPFGHSGEHELRELMRDNGGFEHNVQALRIVDLLERPYPQFVGLNLTYETRESILKHGPDAAGELAKEFSRHRQPWLEAQLVDLADSLAYYTHDLDDGLRFGVFSVSDLDDVELWQDALHAAHAQVPSATATELMRPALQQTLKIPIADLLRETQSRLRQANLTDPLAARGETSRLVSFSETMKRKQNRLRQFLFERFYRADQIERSRQEGRKKLQALFHYYTERPNEMAEWAVRRHRENADIGLPRIVCDYVAGMTDRYVAQEHQRLMQT